MTRRRGQSLVEFALILPMFALLLFGLIYGGIMFLQWLNMSNDSRAEARRYAVMTESQIKEALGDPLPTETNPKAFTGADRFGSFYKVTQKFWIENDSSTAKPKDVVVTLELERNNDDLPNILRWMDWPPEKLKTLEYRMKLEDKNLTGRE